MPNDAPGGMLVCTRCGVVIEVCAFCERLECPEAICARSLRIELGQALTEPYGRSSASSSTSWRTGAP